jgi:hypothetical protein
MTDENRNQEKKGSQRANEQSWSNDPKHVPGQHASDPNPSDKQYDKTEPMQRTTRDPGTRTRPDEYVAGGSGGSQTPNQGSRPGSPKPGVGDDDVNIREPKTGSPDDEGKRGGMGKDRDTDPDEPGAGGMGGNRGGMGGPGEDR